MEKVYDKYGGYTHDAEKLEIEIRNILEPIIKRELENQTPIEALEYVITQAVHIETLRQVIKLKTSNVRKG